MEQSSTSPCRRQTSREENPSSTYTRYIKSCFHRRTDAAPYYRQLLDYLQAGAGHGNSFLQTPRYYDLKRQTFYASPGPSTPSEAARGSSRHHPSVAILEGFPSPECISAIGASELVRPELFIGHLDFSRRAPFSHPYFELPSLPSDGGNIIHVRLITLGQTLIGDTGLRSDVQSRLQADERCLEYENQLFHVKQYGATRFRKVHLHSSRIFSVEQMVSFSVAQRGNDPWCGKPLATSIRLECRDAD